MARDIREVIILKDGSSINGEVLVKKFVLTMSYGELKFAKSEILHIEYANPPYLFADEIRISAGTKLSGMIGPDVIPVKIDGTGQRIEIPKSAIHSLIFFTLGKRLLPKALRQQLKAVSSGE